MRTQAWGWLAAAVLAAGLNSSYHDGGLQWAHEIANNVQHNTNAVLALATGRADRFLAEARMLQLDRGQNRAFDAEDSAVSAEVRHCPFAVTRARAQNSFDQAQAEFDDLQALSAREQAEFARLEANRARIEARVGRQFARDKVRFADDNFSFAESDFTPVVVQVPRIHCPRVHVAMPHIPRVRVQIPRIEAPVVRIDSGDEGPI